MPSFVRVMALVGPIAWVPVFAMAQSTNGGSPPPGAAPASSSSAADADAPAADPAGSSKAVVPATGYSYTDSSASPRVDRAPARPAHPNPAGADALMAGFETLADGSSRLFVELTKPAAFDARPARSTLTYVLKATRVDRHNNQNPLVTLHFNTPVTSARLTPHGSDVWLVVDVRSAVQPTVTMDATKDGAATLRVDFPKGDYLPPQSDVLAAPAPVPREEAGAPASPAPGAPALPQAVAAARPGRTQRSPHRASP
jgi:hypothetical protein